MQPKPAHWGILIAFLILDSTFTYGSCQVKTNPRIREKLALVGPHPPTPLSIFFYFGKHVEQKNDTEKHKISKKRQSRVGA